MHLHVAHMWHQMVKYLARNQYQEQKKQAQPAVEKLWTKDFSSISLLNLLIFVGGNMLVTTFPFYIKSLGGDELTVGLAAGIYSLAALATRPVTGWFLDNHSRKVIFVVGLSGVMLFPILYLAFPILSMAMVFRVFHGSLWSAAGTSSNTNACDIVPNSRFAEGMGFFGLTHSFALAVSPALGLLIMERYGFNPMFLTSTGFSLLALLLLSRIRLHNPPHRRRKSGSLRLRDRLSALFAKDALPARFCTVQDAGGCSQSSSKSPGCASVCDRRICTRRLRPRKSPASAGSSMACTISELIKTACVRPTWPMKSQSLCSAAKLSAPRARTPS